MPNKKIDSIDKFFKKHKHIKISAGEIFLEAEAEPGGIYYLNRGYIRQFIISEGGSELTIHIYEPHAFFPLNWGFNKIPNRYNFQALTDVEVYIAPFNEVKKLVTSKADLAEDLIKRLLLGIDGLSKRIESIAFGKAYNRVVSILIYLTNHFGEKMDHKVVINKRFTHQEIASLVGISRERTSIELEKLVKKEIIKYDSHSIIIKDFKRLKQELS